MGYYKSQQAGLAYRPGIQVKGLRRHGIAGLLFIKSMSFPDAYHAGR
jgi:hypothetical protein